MAARTWETAGSPSAMFSVVVSMTTRSGASEYRSCSMRSAAGGPPRRVDVATTRTDRSCSASRRSFRSSSSRTKRRPTLPYPMTATSARIGDRQGIEHFADAVKCAGQEGGMATEPEPQIPIHVKVIAWHDQDAPFVTQPLHERCGVDVVRIADEDDGACVRRHVRQRRAPLQPTPDDRIVRTD